MPGACAGHFSFEDDLPETGIVMLRCPGLQRIMRGLEIIGAAFARSNARVAPRREESI
jgi:hypothetical protein